MDETTSRFLVALIEIVWLDFLLAGDNAVLLALLTRGLRPEQRRAGVMLGALAFMVLRIAFTFALFVLLALAYAKILGALVLLVTAARLARGEIGSTAQNAPAGRALAAVVGVAALADAPLALQNMLAVQAAAKGDHALALLGLAISIPMLAFGSSMVVGILRKAPILVWSGVAFLGWLAGQLAGADVAVGQSLMPAEILADWAGPTGASLALLVAYIAKRAGDLPKIAQE